MNFVISLLVLNNWKSKSYNFILIIVDCLTKIVYYKPIKVTINVSGLAQVIINIIVCHYDISK